MELRKNFKYLALIQKETSDKLDELLKNREQVTLAEVENYEKSMREFNLPCQTVQDVLDLINKIAEIDCRNRLVIKTKIPFDFQLRFDLFKRLIFINDNFLI